MMNESTEPTRPETAETAAQPEALAAEAAPAAPAPEDTIKALETEVARLKDAYVRAHAEMENVRKRTAAELENRSRFAVQNFAKDVLPVADNLRRALDSLPQSMEGADDTLKNLVVGLEMTEKGLIDSLERHGIHEVPGVGSPFDPHVHQAVQEIEDATVPAGTVLHLLQSGYVLHDRLLRAAMVIVSRGGPKGSGMEPGGPGKTVDTQA